MPVASDSSCADVPIREAVRYEFTVIPGSLVSDKQFEESSVFFSTHYGIWGPLVTFSKSGTCVCSCGYLD